MRTIEERRHAIGDRRWLVSSWFIVVLAGVLCVAVVLAAGADGDLPTAGVGFRVDARPDLPDARDYAGAGAVRLRSSLRTR
jgi:hypothetical protein